MPKPTLFDEPVQSPVSVKLTEQQRAELRQVARENNSTVAGVIRDAVNSYVGDYKDAQVFGSPKRRAPAETDR